MPRETKTGPATFTPTSFFSLLSGWVQQGVESFFATQRVLIDLALRQNAVAMKSLREGFSDPEHYPLAVMSELAIEGTSSFMEAQRILLHLAQQENELLLTGVKERVAGSAPAVAATDAIRRTIGTFLDMEQDFLKITSKQTLDWLESAKKGKYMGTHLVDLARESMETFVHAQKKFLDVIAQETARLTNGKPEKLSHTRKTELAKLARDASTAFIEAQKNLLDVVGQQMNVNLKAAVRTMELMNPSRLLSMANLTGEGVKSFVEAEKAVIQSMAKPAKTAERKRRATGRKAMAKTAAA